MDDFDHGVLWAWTLPELLAVLALFVLLVASLAGASSFYSSVSWPVRAAIAGLLAVELLIPAWVYYDLRRSDAEDTFWVHVAAMPVLNLFGLFAYLQDRELDRN